MPYALRLPDIETYDNPPNPSQCPSSLTTPPSSQFFACLCRTSQERSLQSHSPFFSYVYSKEALVFKTAPQLSSTASNNILAKIHWLIIVFLLAFLLPLRQLLSCAYIRCTMFLCLLLLPLIPFLVLTTCQKNIRLLLLSPFISQAL